MPTRSLFPRLFFALCCTLAFALLPSLASAEPAPAAAPAAEIEPSTRLPLGSDLPARDTKLTNINDAPITLAEVVGPKGTLVFFTCNHCPFVKAWESRIATIGNTYKAQGVGVISINSNDPAVRTDDDLTNMKTRASDLGLTFPYAVDAGSTVAKAFGATRTPDGRQARQRFLGSGDLGLALAEG